MLWWSTRCTRDIKEPKPLNIRCTGVDLTEHCLTRHPNITYRSRDFEGEMDLPTKHFDVLWCHDSFQYVRDPFATLVRWRERTNPNGMLALILPQTTNLVRNRQQFEALDRCHYHWTLPSLLYMLAVSGWDCARGAFLKRPDDPWIHAVVYRSESQPKGLGSRWYDLADAGLLPTSAAEGIRKRGYLSQQDLVLPWLEKSLISYDRY